MGAWQRVGKVLAVADLAQFDLWVCFFDRGEGLFTRAVDGVKVDDAVFLLVLEISQDRVHT